MNIFRFLYQLTCSHPVRKMKCECGEEYRKLCSWKDIRKECKGCPYLYFECQECGKKIGEIRMSDKKTLREDYPLRDDYTYYSDDITPMLWAILIGAVLAQLIIWSLGFGLI